MTLGMGTGIRVMWGCCLFKARSWCEPEAAGSNFWVEPLSPGHLWLREWSTDKTAVWSMVHQSLLTLPRVTGPPRIFLFLQPDVTPPFLKSANHIWMPDVELDLHESA